MRLLDVFVPFLIGVVGGVLRDDILALLNRKQRKQEVDRIKEQTVLLTRIAGELTRKNNHDQLLAERSRLG